MIDKKMGDELASNTEQPSPESTQSDNYRDAARWRRFVQLMQLKVSEMTLHELDCWAHALMPDGRITNDMIAKLDKLIEGDAGAGAKL